jgi:hypothetical protein
MILLASNWRFGAGPRDRDFSSPHRSRSDPSLLASISIVLPELPEHLESTVTSFEFPTNARILNTASADAAATSKRHPLIFV